MATEYQTLAAQLRTTATEDIHLQAAEAILRMGSENGSLDSQVADLTARNQQQCASIADLNVQNNSLASQLITSGAVNIDLQTNVNRLVTIIQSFDSRFTL